MSEKKVKENEISRRKFIANSALATAGFYIVPRYVIGGAGYVAPSDRLNIAGIGVGGKGHSDLTNTRGFKKEDGSTLENVVALADVDDERAARSFANYPKATRFRDFRKMLDKMGKDIDAVTVSTPDHNHAVAAMMAMKMGKHVYVQKPLTHDIYEARMLTEAARKYKVVTQMGNQGNSSNDIRRICEWVWAGAIGDVHKVDCWTNRPVWPQGIPSPTGKHDIPKTLDWDLWLGTAPSRDYNPDYLPFSWRGWWDYGTGALGDMACHIVDPVFKALKLGYPESVECSVGHNFSAGVENPDYSNSGPSSSAIHFDFPKRGEMPEVKLNWYDGGIKPERPREFGEEPLGRNGVIFYGTAGMLHCDVYAANPRLMPVSKMDMFKEPTPTLKRIEDGHYRDWVAACKGGDPASSNFDYAGPLTETVLMGNLAIRSYSYKEGEGRNSSYPGRKRLFWDGENMKITNFEPANQFVRRNYRDGWSL